MQVTLWIGTREYTDIDIFKDYLEDYYFERLSNGAYERDGFILTTIENNGKPVGVGVVVKVLDNLEDGFEYLRMDLRDLSDTLNVIFKSKGLECKIHVEVHSGK